jgi:hypothetical protein
VRKLVPCAPGCAPFDSTPSRQHSLPIRTIRPAHLSPTSTSIFPRHPHLPWHGASHENLKRKTFIHCRRAPPLARPIDANGDAMGASAKGRTQVPGRESLKLIHARAGRCSLRSRTTWCGTRWAPPQTPLSASPSGRRRRALGWAACRCDAGKGSLLPCPSVALRGLR